MRMGFREEVLMRRTAVLQGVRMMKFWSVLDRYESRELSQLEAAELRGIGERTFRRWCGRYREGGEAGHRIAVSGSRRRIGCRRRRRRG